MYFDDVLLITAELNGLKIKTKSFPILDKNKYSTEMCWNSIKCF